MRAGPIPEGYLAAYGQVGKNIITGAEGIGKAVEGYLKKQERRNLLDATIGNNLNIYNQLLDIEDKDARYFPRYDKQGFTINESDAPTYDIRQRLKNLADLTLEEKEALYGSLEARRNGFDAKLKQRAYQTGQTQDLLAEAEQEINSRTLDILAGDFTINAESNNPEAIAKELSAVERALQAAKGNPQRFGHIIDDLERSYQSLSEANKTLQTRGGRRENVTRAADAAGIYDQDPIAQGDAGRVISNTGQGWGAVNAYIERMRANGAPAAPAASEAPAAAAPASGAAQPAPAGPVAPSVEGTLTAARDRANRDAEIASRQNRPQPATMPPIPNPLLKKATEPNAPKAPKAPEGYEGEIMLDEEGNPYAATEKPIPLVIPDNYVPKEETPPQSAPKGVSRLLEGEDKPAPEATPAQPPAGLSRLAPPEEGQNVPSPMEDALRRYGPTEEAAPAAQAAPAVEEAAARAAGQPATDMGGAGVRARPTAQAPAQAQAQAPAQQPERVGQERLQQHSTVSTFVADPNIPVRQKASVLRDIASGAEVLADVDANGKKTSIITGTPALPAEMQVDPTVVREMRESGVNPETFVRDREDAFLRAVESGEMSSRIEEATTAPNIGGEYARGAYANLGIDGRFSRELADQQRRQEEIVAKARENPNAPWVHEHLGPYANAVVGGSMALGAAYGKWKLEKAEIARNVDARRQQTQARYQTNQYYKDGYDEARVDAETQQAETDAKTRLEGRAKIVPASALRAAEKAAQSKLDSEAKDSNGKWKLGWNKKRYDAELQSRQQAARAGVKPVWRSGWGPKRFNDELQIERDKARARVEAAAYDSKPAKGGARPVFAKGWNQARIDAEVEDWYNKTYGPDSPHWANRGWNIGKLSQGRLGLQMHKVWSFMHRKGIVNFTTGSAPIKSQLGSGLMKGAGWGAAFTVGVQTLAGLSGPEEFWDNVEAAMTGRDQSMPLWMQGRGTLGDADRVKKLIDEGRRLRETAKEQAEALEASPEMVYEGTSTAVANQQVQGTTAENLPASIARRELQRPDAEQAGRPVAATSIQFPARGTVPTRTLMLQTADTLDQKGETSFSVFDETGRMNQMIHALAYQRGISVHPEQVPTPEQLKDIKTVLSDVFKAEVTVADDGTVTMVANDRKPISYLKVDPELAQSAEERSAAQRRNFAIDALRKRGIPATEANIQRITEGYLSRNNTIYTQQASPAGVAYGEPTTKQVSPTMSAKELLELRQTEQNVAKSNREFAALVVGTPARTQDGTIAKDADGNAIVTAPVTWNEKSNVRISDKFTVAGTFRDDKERAQIIDEQLESAADGLEVLELARTRLGEIDPTLLDADGKINPNWQGGKGELTPDMQTTYRTYVVRLVRALSKGLGPMAGNDYKFVYEQLGVPQDLISLLNTPNVDFQKIAGYLVEKGQKNPAFMRKVHDTLEAQFRMKVDHVNTLTNGRVRTGWRNYSRDEQSRLLPYDTVSGDLTSTFNARLKRETTTIDRETNKPVGGPVAQAMEWASKPQNFVGVFKGKTTAEIQALGIKQIAATLGYDESHVRRMLAEMSQKGREANNRTR